MGQHENHADAFASYEKIMRPFVTQAQNIPTFAPRLASPHSRLGIAIAIGYSVLNMANKPGFNTLLKPLLSPKADAIDLPHYPMMD